MVGSHWAQCRVSHVHTAAGRLLWQWYLELEDQGALTTACKTNSLQYGATLKGVVSDLVFSTKRPTHLAMGYSAECSMRLL